MPLIWRIKSGRVRRLEEQMDSMNSKIDEMAETFESRRADDEAAAIAAERIRSGAADQTEDGTEALKSGLPGSPKKQRRDLQAAMKKHEETLRRLAQ